MAAGSDCGLQEGDLVYFTVESVYLPAPAEVLAELTTAEQLVGRVVQLSGSGDRQDVYAVISLASHANIVVPSDKVERIRPESSKGI